MYIETFDHEKINKARDRWSGLSESDLRGVGNDSERLVDVVARKNGIDRAQASREVDEFLSSCGCDHKSGDPSATLSESSSTSKVGSTASGSRGQGGASESGQRSSTSQPGNRPGTSTDDQTGEMASAQPGRKTRPEPKNL